MSEEAIFKQAFSEYRREHVRPMTLEFEKAVARGAVSQALALKYLHVLNTYAENIHGSPFWAMEPITAADAALRQGSAKELEWVSAERAYILAQVGDVLPTHGE